MKPEQLKITKIKLTRINGYQISTLEIDLIHINYGLTKKKGYGSKKRSNFTEADVANFFQSLDGIELNVEADDAYDYFIAEKKYISNQLKYKIIFCIRRDQPTTSGIITLFQTKKGDA